MKLFFTLATLALSTKAYWLMAAENFITTQRIDPIVNPGQISSHAHSVLGGSNFGMKINTALLRQSQCTSIPIPQDKSNYWFPHLYFQWANGSFSSLDGGAVIYYLFSDTPGNTTAFPDDFRMLSGTPTLRTYDPTSFAQQAVTFLCLDFNGVSTKYNSLPPTTCPSGIRAQINFPSCWDGKNVDSADHKSHVAFLSTGPDSGTCSDPKYPVTLPRIFMEVYWSSQSFDQYRSQAKNTAQPFVYSSGDPTGYGYHADFVNGWDAGVLQKAVDNCHCNPYGDPTCCVSAGIFNMNQGQSCHITKSINEQTTGTLLKLPGNNPVQPEGKTATVFPDTNPPQLISPVYAYTGAAPTATGNIVNGPAPTPGNLVAPAVVLPVFASPPTSYSSTPAGVISKSTPVSQGPPPAVAPPAAPPVAPPAQPPSDSSSSSPSYGYSSGSSSPHEVDAALPASYASGSSSSSPQDDDPDYDECEEMPKKRPAHKGKKHSGHRRSPVPLSRISRFTNNDGHVF